MRWTFKRRLFRVPLPPIEVSSWHVIGLLGASLGFVVSLVYVGWMALQSERRIWLTDAIPQRVAEAHWRFEEAIDLLSRAELQRGPTGDLAKQAQALREASVGKLEEARLLALLLHDGGASEIGNVGPPRGAAEDAAGIRLAASVARFRNSANARWRETLAGQPLSIWGVNSSLDQALDAVHDDILKEAAVLRDSVLSSVRAAHIVQAVLATIFGVALLSLVAIPAFDAARARRDAIRRQLRAGEQIHVVPLTAIEKSERPVLASAIRASSNDWISVARRRKETQAALWIRMYRLGLVRNDD